MKKTIYKVVQPEITEPSEVEIDLPAFYKNGKFYHKIVDEFTVITVKLDVTGDWKLVGIDSRQFDGASPHTLDDALSGEEISAEEFIGAYNKTQQIINDTLMKPILDFVNNNKT